MLLKIDLLIKCILLLFRENELKVTDNSNIESSGDMIKNILNIYKNNRRVLSGGETLIMEELKELILNMISNPDGYDATSLTQQLDLILRDSTSVKNNLISGINMEFTTQGLKRSILTLRNYLNNHYKELEFYKIISTTMAKLRNNELEGNVQTYTSNLISQLDALTLSSSVKDPGIVDELDIVDESIETVFTRVKKYTDSSERLKTGWKELNDMLGGGYRYGEFCLSSALQHSYKSGFIRSVFAQLCMYNKPTLLDKEKKPLALFISLEDDSDIIMGFFYQYLHYSEFGNIPDIKTIPANELAAYVKSKLTINGFHVKIIRVNPSEWSYIHLTNKLLTYEANGYELKIVAIDYLSKLPTIGCNRSGAMGTDIRDLFDKVRNFSTSRNILLLNCHQMNVEVKQLLKNGVNDKTLVKELVGKGYYEGSKQLDQVVDLEIHQHIAKIGDRHYLTFQRGKRRYPEVIPESKKFFMLPFPPEDLNIPCIPPNLDLEGNYIGFAYDDIEGNKKEVSLDDLVLDL